MGLVEPVDPIPPLEPMTPVKPIPVRVPAKIAPIEPHVPSVSSIADPAVVSHETPELSPSLSTTAAAAPLASSSDLGLSKIGSSAGGASAAITSSVANNNFVEQSIEQALKIKYLEQKID